MYVISYIIIIIIIIIYSGAPGIWVQGQSKRFFQDRFNKRWRPPLPYINFYADVHSGGDDDVDGRPRKRWVGGVISKGEKKRLQAYKNIENDYRRIHW